jgi:Sulfotransferase family
MEKPSVIYIMGCGRSGSTLLDIIIGNHKGVLSTGELIGAEQPFIKNGMCSCGAPIRECAIWKNIYRKHLRKHNQYLTNHIERNRFIFKTILNLHNPERIQAYNSYVLNFFQILHKSSFAKFIVDSSNSVGRALALLKNVKIDVRVIHLVRDPRGVYYSFQKKNVNIRVRGILSFALYWNFVNFLATLVRLIHGKKVLRVRYEDLVSAPDQLLDLIGNHLNEDFYDVKKILIKKIPLQKGHLCLGNRMGWQNQPLILMPDYKWVTALKRRERLIVTALRFPMMVAYGYSTKKRPH